MKTIKLLVVIEMVCMYNIALSYNGVVQIVSWAVLITSGLVMAALLEKRYVRE